MKKIVLVMLCLAQASSVVLGFGVPSDFIDYENHYIGTREITIITEEGQNQNFKVNNYDSDARNLYEEFCIHINLFKRAKKKDDGIESFEIMRSYNNLSQNINYFNFIEEFSHKADIITNENDCLSKLKRDYYLFCIVSANFINELSREENFSYISLNILRDECATKKDFEKLNNIFEKYHSRFSAYCCDENS